MRKMTLNMSEAEMDRLAGTEELTRLKAENKKLHKQVKDLREHIAFLAKELERRPMPEFKPDGCFFLSPGCN